MSRPTKDKTAKKGKKLSAQQKKFCQEWVIDFNLADAWLRAGYKTKNRTLAKAHACRFMATNGNAIEYIEKLLAKQEQRAEKSADDIIRELEKLGFSNIKNYLNIKGDEVYFKDFSELTDEQAAAIESVKAMKKTIRAKNKEDDDVEIQAIQVKLHSKITALTTLAKRYRMFGDNAISIDKAIFILGNPDAGKANTSETIPGRVL